MSEEASMSNHPGSCVLAWWRSTSKDDEGFATLTNLIDYLHEQSEVRGRMFLKRLKTSQWKEEYGFRLRAHGHKPNRVKLESLIVMGLVCRHHP